MFAERFEDSPHVGREGSFGFDPLIRSRMTKAKTKRMECLSADNNIIQVAGQS